jgi:hypothetical protein
MSKPTVFKPGPWDFYLKERLDGGKTYFFPFAKKGAKSKPCPEFISFDSGVTVQRLGQEICQTKAEMWRHLRDKLQGRLPEDDWQWKRLQEMIAEEEAEATA